MVTGYRAFAIRGDEEEVYLYPPAHMGDTIPLEYPLTRALCGGGSYGVGEHKAPKKNCTCGYYAYNNFGGASDYLHRGTAMVMAEVWGHGRVEEHTNGWRSEKMQIVRFFHPLCDSNDGDDVIQSGTYGSRNQRVCNEAADFFWTDTADREDDEPVGSWPAKLRFGCDVHASIRIALAEKRAKRAMELTGQMFGAGPGPRPATELIRMMAEKFEASVFDHAATLTVFEKNAEWHAVLAERGTHRTALEQAKYRARRQANDAKAAMFDVGDYRGWHSRLDGIG